jgi:hypothetical protein
MNNVIHSIWKNKYLKGHQLSESLDLFYARIPTWRTQIPKIYCYDIEEILRKALEFPDLDWLVVHGEGNIYRSQDRVLNVIENFIKILDPKILVAGHLVEKPGHPTGLHHKFLIINLKTYSALGRPNFGAGTENVGGREGSIGGWNFVNVSKEHGLEIAEIPAELNKEKIYLSPELETERVLNNINGLYNIIPTSNIDQNRIITHLLIKKMGLSDIPRTRSIAEYAPRKKCVFAFNTELLVPDPEWIRNFNRGPLECFIGTCAGFLDICNFKNFGFVENTKMIYYDLNPDSILFKEHLLNNFDGRLDNLWPFIREFQNRHPDIIIFDSEEALSLSDLRKEFASDEEFYHIWQKMRKLERKFIRLNLFDDYEKIIDAIEHKNVRTLLCISDIFSGTNELTYGLRNLKNIFCNMLEYARHCPEMVIQGTDFIETPVIGYAKDLYKSYVTLNQHASTSGLTIHL